MTIISKNCFFLLAIATRKVDSGSDSEQLHNYQDMSMYVLNEPDHKGHIVDLPPPFSTALCGYPPEMGAYRVVVGG